MARAHTFLLKKVLKGPPKQLEKMEPEPPNSGSVLMNLTLNFRNPRPIPLFRWNGIVFSTNGTVIFLFAILILSLRFRLFPLFFSNLSGMQYWAMALLTATGIALSIIAHEMAHLWVARRIGETPHGVFLFLFGTGKSIALKGTARAQRTSLYLAGVLCSVALAAALLGLALLSEMNARNELFVGILFHLGAFNLSLALFQLLPVLALDGGKFILNVLSRDGLFRPWAILAFYFLGNLVGLAFIVTAIIQLYSLRPVLAFWIAALGVMLIKANYQEYSYLTAKADK